MQLLSSQKFEHTQRYFDSLDSDGHCGGGDDEDDDSAAVADEICMIKIHILTTGIIMIIYHVYFFHMYN